LERLFLTDPPKDREGGKFSPRGFWGVNTSGRYEGKDMNPAMEGHYRGNLAIREWKRPEGRRQDRELLTGKSP